MTSMTLRLAWPFAESKTNDDIKHHNNYSWSITQSAKKSDVLTNCRSAVTERAPVVEKRTHSDNINLCRQWPYFHCHHSGHVIIGTTFLLINHIWLLTAHFSRSHHSAFEASCPILSSNHLSASCYSCNSLDYIVWGSAAILWRHTKISMHQLHFLAMTYSAMLSKVGKIRGSADPDHP